MIRRQIVILGVTVALLVGGCAATKHARTVEKSGFLADVYPLMHKGKEDEALLVYRNPKTKDLVKTYDKIQLDPVTIWRGKESQLKGVSKEDLQRLADRFYSTIYLELGKDYEMVDKPGPRTFRIQVAITKVEESMVAPVIISKVVPQARLLSMAKDVATGKPAFVGEASVEGKLTEAQTGELLAASIDRRIGGKSLNAESFDSWGDVYEILEFWAKQLRFNFCQGRGETNCVHPKE